MPINIPDNLPAIDVLLHENIFSMDSNRAKNQNIRPMEVGILNLMPNKIETEIQLLRLLSNTPLQINVDLIRIDATAPKNTPESHMRAFYHQFDDIAEKRYDGLIITGAPLGFMNYEHVKYWEKMTKILDWAKLNVQSTLFLCWAAHAAMYHYYGVTRTLRQRKLSGVYEHQVIDPTNELVRGFDPVFWAPHSRIGEISVAQYEATNKVKVLVKSDVAGAYVSASHDKRLVFVTGHPEYDADTLDVEYQRDLNLGLTPNIPENYYQHDNPDAPAIVRWRSSGSLLLANWLNYYVYQVTPYDLNTLSSNKGE